MNGHGTHLDETLAAAGKPADGHTTGRRAATSDGPAAVEGLHYRVQFFGIVNPDEMGRSDSTRVQVASPEGDAVDVPELVASFVGAALGQREGVSFRLVKKEYNGYEDAGYIAFADRAEAERAYEGLLECARRALSCTAMGAPGEDIYLSFDVKLLEVARTAFEAPARKSDRTRLNGETVQAWWDQDQDSHTGDDCYVN